MQDYDHTNEQERCFSDSLVELQKITKQMARLNLRKDELTSQMISALQHEHEGQKTYEFGMWKIEVKTPFVYSLNKKLYESGEVSLPKNFNPIKKSVSYSVDKRLVDKYIEEAPIDVRDALIELIDKKPGKASITLKERLS